MRDRTYPSAKLLIAESECPSHIQTSALRGAWAKGYVDGERGLDIDPYESPTKSATGWSYVLGSMWRRGYAAARQRFHPTTKP